MSTPDRERPTGVEGAAPEDTPDQTGAPAEGERPAGRPVRGRVESRSIGQVLASLKGDFPDISISKIRFLETEGLITPQRAPSGYRRYTTADVERLRYVLTVQRDRYLPLKVIRDHLESIDTGRAEAGEESLPTARSSTPGAVPTPPVPSSSTAQPRTPVRLSRAELLEASGLTDSALAELERNSIVTPRRGTTHYGREALTLAAAARRLSEYGIEGRHLRAFKMSADREVGLVEQAIAPYVRSANNRDVSGEVTALVISFHAALVRMAMDR